MKTIDLSPSDVLPTQKMRLPRNWKEAQIALGVTQSTLDKRRKALGGMDRLLDEEFFEELKEICFWCSMRQKGGGASCTEHEYVRLKEEEPEFLQQRLQQLKEKMSRGEN